MPAMAAHWAMSQSWMFLPKYRLAAVWTPLQPLPKFTTFRYAVRISSLEYFFSRLMARKISVILRVRLTSLSPVMFLTSCCVMEEPPYVPSLSSFVKLNRFTAAPNVRYQSTPLCSRKRLSSIATIASCMACGILSWSTQMRFSVPERLAYFTGAALLSPGPFT